MAAGFNVTLYGYEPIAGLPAGVTFGNAEDIVERRYLNGFIVNGKPSLSHFSDLFRYRLFAATGEAWVDMDLLCLKPFDMPTDRNFFARETDSSISSSVLRIDRGQPELETLIAQTESYGSGAQFEWGSTGPALLTKTFPKEVLDQALEPKHFFPVPWDEWWKPFVPSAREECEQLCSEASAIHLWNNIVERSGYWKDLAPPRGSYLHAALERQDLLGAFRDTYPEQVMEHIAHNYRDSRTARAHAGQATRADHGAARDRRRAEEARIELITNGRETGRWSGR